MRILILSLRVHHNFGGILQAYALKTVLTNMGHEVKLLDKAEGSHREDPKFLESFDLSSPINQHTRNFVKQHFSLRTIKNFNDLQESEFDAIIVGSDQVWRKQFFIFLYDEAVQNAFLSFAKDWKNIKRIAYAPSFGFLGCDAYTEEEIKDCRELLKQFEAVSVREDDGKTICRDIFGIDAETVLDPTMLLDSEVYEPLCREYRGRHKDKIIAYFIDNNEENHKMLEDCSLRLGKKAFMANSKAEETNVPLEERIQYPVEEWLAAFMDAEFVVTDSLHACIFSVIFGKPFVVRVSEWRGRERVMSFLKTIHLEDRMIDSPTDFTINTSNDDIISAQSVLKELRKPSLIFLNSIN